MDTGRLLSQSARAGPRQRVVASIGKLPGLDKEEKVGWKRSRELLNGKSQPQDSLFKKTEEPPSMGHSRYPIE